MAELLFSVPLQEGGEKVLRDLAHLVKSRLWEQYDRSRRRAGANYVRWWVQELDGRKLFTFYIDADDPESALRAMAREASGVNEYVASMFEQAIGRDPRHDPPAADLILEWDRAGTMPRPFRG